MAPTVTTKSVKLARLVCDFTLYPRNHVDDVNVRRLKEAIEAGEELPPVIADRKSLRLIDGFHRWEAMHRMDPEGSILVQLRTYPNESAMVLDAIRTNARHGLPLSSYDRARAISMADEFKITQEAIAEALGVPLVTPEKIKAHQTAFRADGKPMMVKRPLRHLAGKKLTKKQETANQRSNGWPVYFLANQIINLLESNAVDWDDKRNAEALTRLTACLSRSAKLSV